MGPIGFFVYNEKNDELYDLESTIVWNNAKGLEDLNIPSAAERYASYEGISNLSKEKLHWVLPEPQKIKQKEINRSLPKSLDINFGEFKLNSSFLTKRLQKGTQIKISKKL